MNSFDPQIHGKITEFIERHEKDPKGRKVAVFDADGTLWSGDVGESFFKYELEKKLLKPEQIGLPEHTDLWAHYWNEVQNGGAATAYGWLAQWHAGLSENDLTDRCKEFVKERFKHCVFEPMRLLTHSLMNAGFEIWVVSASPYWIVLECVRGFGVQPDHVIGTAVTVENGTLTSNLVLPVPYRAGKVEHIMKSIGVKPLLAAGNTIWDLDMLTLAQELALSIHSEQATEANFAPEQQLKRSAENEAAKKTQKIWLTQGF